MTTTEPAPLTENARYVESLPVGTLHAAPHNRQLRDLDQLAASITQVGVLQPILVRTNPNGPGFEIIDGARRHAAAVLAGLVLVPCLVDNGQTDQQVELDRIIANVQRDDPTELEEAAAYNLLINTYGMTASEVAVAVGRSDSHVSKRRSLLTLPAEAQAALADHRINVTIALGIAELAKAADEQRLNRVVDELPRTTDRGEELEAARQVLESSINHELAHAKAAEHRDAVIAELEKAGETVIDYPAGGSWAGTGHRVCRDGEPAEAYSVDPRGHTMKLTTQPVPAAERRATVPKPKSGDDIGFVEQARRKAAQVLRDAYEARVAAMRAILAGAATRGELLDHVLRSLLEVDGETQPTLECTLLGIELDPDTSRGAALGEIAAYRQAHADDDPLEQAAARIMAIVDPLDNFELAADDIAAADRAHYELLERAGGYQPTPAEQKALNPIADAE